MDHCAGLRYLGWVSHVTGILNQIDQGDAEAAEKLLPVVYEELRKLASARLSKRKPGELFQPTLLVHEAYVRLVDVAEPQQWNGRGHFFGAAAEAMRRILVEHARRKRSAKHGGEHQRVELNIETIVSETPGNNLLALDEAFTEFENQWPDKANLVKLKYFAGLTITEASAAMTATELKTDSNARAVWQELVEQRQEECIDFRATGYAYDAAPSDIVFSN